MSERRETIRAEVLAVPPHGGGPVSAHDVLGAMRESRPGIAPPTVYRALAPLTDRGAVHRRDSPTTFIACRCDRHARAAVPSICDSCGPVEESAASEHLHHLSSMAGKSGFRPSRRVIEIHGFCASCGAGQVPA